MASSLVARLERCKVELERDVDLNDGRRGGRAAARSGLRGREVSLKQRKMERRHAPADQSRQSRTSGERSPCPLVQGRSLVRVVGVGPNERTESAHLSSKGEGEQERTQTQSSSVETISLEKRALASFISPVLVSAAWSKGMQRSSQG